MFKLLRAWDAERELTPEDFQYILTPREAFSQARVFYDLSSDSYHYPDKVSGHDIPRRKSGHVSRFSEPDKRRRTEYADEVFDNTERNIDFGWIIGIDTAEHWDCRRNPFFFDDEGDLVYDCFMGHYHDWFEMHVRREYEKCLNNHNGRKPAPTVKQVYYSDAPIQHAQAGKTINSKAAGRLLAAGGVYNGNVEGFRRTAEQLGGETPAGYDQVMDNKGLLITGASIAAGLTMGRIKFPDLEELEYFGAKGTSSGRAFDPELAGGPIENLTTDGINITHEGIATVEKHVMRFDPDPGNEFMVNRLKKIADGDIAPEQVDLNYYTHECREYQRYCNLGWETGRPSDNMEAYNLWNNTHAATLEDYKLKGEIEDLYHPDAPSW